MPFLCFFCLVLRLFYSIFHLAQWRSAISTTLIQSQPTCQSRQDTTPTAILSPLITYTVSLPFLFHFIHFLSPSFSLSFSFPHLFSPLALPLSLLSYGRKAAQAQGNGINFHSRLNSQSISLELNTLPPIRKSQSSISPFPRRHSPAIQRRPRQPCLTF